MDAVQIIEYLAELTKNGELEWKYDGNSAYYARLRDRYFIVRGDVSHYSVFVRKCGFWGWIQHESNPNCIGFFSGSNSIIQMNFFCSILESRWGHIPNRFCGSISDYEREQQTLRDISDAIKKYEEKDVPATAISVSKQKQVIIPVQKEHVNVNS